MNGPNTPTDAEFTELPPDDGAPPNGGPDPIADARAKPAEDEGEIQLPATIPYGATVISRAEIDGQVATAKAYPRSVTSAIEELKSLVSLDQQTAIDSIYTLKRAGKPIIGPSIRFAELGLYAWGNARVSGNIVGLNRDEKIIIAEAVFHDIERNVATKQVVWRRVSDKRGRLFSDDMIIVTGNAAKAIVTRNVILAGIPRPLWLPVFEHTRNVAKGDIKTLSARREAALMYFMGQSVEPELVFGALKVKGVEDIGLDEMLLLHGWATSIKEGSDTAENIFRPREATNFETVPAALSAKPPEAKPEEPPAELPKAGANDLQARVPGPTNAVQYDSYVRDIIKRVGKDEKLIEWYGSTAEADIRKRCGVSVGLAEQLRTLVKERQNELRREGRKT